MLAYAQSGETVFTACLRLFRDYPLAVRRHYAEHRYGSMVMMSRDTGKAHFFVLIMERTTSSPSGRGTGVIGRGWRSSRANPSTTASAG